MVCVSAEDAAHSIVSQSLHGLYAHAHTVVTAESQAPRPPSHSDHAGLHDSRVSFWEPAKWVAKTRQLTTGHPVILLLIQMAAGHAGVSGVFSQLRETALEQAFLLRAICAAAQPHTQVE